MKKNMKNKNMIVLLLGLFLLALCGLTVVYYILPPNNTIILPHPVSYSNVICHGFKGRLGNQLFQYASVLGLAHKLNKTAVFYHSPILTSALQYPPPTPTVQQRQWCRTAKVLREKKCCLFDKAFLKMDPHKDYKAIQYLASWKYFEGMNEEVKKALMFRDSVRQQANKTIEELRKRCNRTLIGLHSRRGDYLNLGAVKGGYSTPPPDYYQKAMNYMRQRFGNVTFLVSVHNKSRKWFLEYVTSAGDVILLTRQEPAVDMALLASLDHVIITAGTYSWWVGFLNKGVTVYWKDFIAHGTPIGNSFDHNGTTFVYPGWIPL